MFPRRLVFSFWNQLNAITFLTFCFICIYEYCYIHCLKIITMSIPVMNFNFFYCFNIHTQLSCVCCSMAVVYESIYRIHCIRNVSGLFQLFCFDMSEHTLQPSDHLILHVSASYFGNNTTNQRRSISDGSYTRQALTAATPGFWTPFYYMS